jgi:NADH-quinone oxidoreductase subunit G
VFVTRGEKIENARAMVEEDLLIRHPIDCPICDKAGECSLQDYHFEHGQDQRRADIKPFTSRRRTLGDTVTLFVDRCVMCSRCVRFCREISGTAELMIENRGAHEEINVFPGFPLDNKLSGNVVDLCPVGALGDRAFLYSQRVWFMKSHDHVCAGCSTGCSIVVDENQDRIYRLRPRENPHINEWWMCDEGRYGWKHVHSDKRQTTPRKLVDGEYQNFEWQQIFDDLHEQLQNSGRIAAAISPHLTVEEAYLFATYLRGINEDALLALGPISIGGEDETFANGFTIRAEKCPNRRGVEEVIRGVDGELRNWNDFLGEVEGGDFGAVWITGGYKTDWIDEPTSERFAKCGTVIVQDLFSSPLWELATYQLPGAAFVERDGSFVNRPVC